MCVTIENQTSLVLSDMNKLLIGIAIAFTLTACAAPRYNYVKDGASAHQRTDALSECEYQIRLNKTPASDQAKLLNLCMQGKGFRMKRIN